MFGTRYGKPYFCTVQTNQIINQPIRPPTDGQNGEDMYKVIEKTDAYHAQMAGYPNHSCQRTIEIFPTLEEANRKMLDIAMDCAETYFDNWGLARIYANRAHSLNNIAAGTTSEGFRWVEYDVYSYEIEECDWYEVREAQFSFFAYYKGESLEEAIEEVESFYSRDGGIEGNTPLEILKDNTSIWNARTDTLEALNALRYE